MTSGLIIISEGKSYSYLIHSSFLAIIILIAGIFHSWLWFLMLPSCVMLLLFTTGVEIDSDKFMVRKYTGWMNYHWGIWLPLRHFKKVELEEFVVSKPTGGLNRYDRTSSKTFDILLISKEDEIYELNDFFDYNKAVLCLNAIKSTGLDSEDKYAIETDRIRETRRVSRRR